MTDVLLYQTSDGGEIDCTNGVIALSDGLSNAVYLSLFGGNAEDSGLKGDDPLQWWGNLGETDPSRTYRSETQHLLRSIPAIPANLRRIEDAVGRDLAWMTADILSLVSARATMPALNRVRIEINTEVRGRAVSFTFDENWGTPT